MNFKYLSITLVIYRRGSTLWFLWNLWVIFLLAWRSNLSSFRDSSGSSQKAGAEKAKMKGVAQNLFFSYLSLWWGSCGGVLDQPFSIRYIQYMNLISVWLEEFRQGCEILGAYDSYLKDTFRFSIFLSLIYMGYFSFRMPDNRLIVR